MILRLERQNDLIQLAALTLLKLKQPEMTVERYAAILFY